MPITNFKAGSSPLTSRANPAIYTVIIVALLFITVALLVWFSLKMLKKYKTSNKYIESTKNKITSISDIKNFSSTYKLLKEEADLLWKICREFHLSNIFYSIKNIDNIIDLFKKFYSEKRDEFTEENLLTFFNLLYKLEKISSRSSIIKSTKFIPLKTEIFNVDKMGHKYKFILTENTKDFMILEPFNDFLSNPNKPEQMQKILFTFTSETKLEYGFVSRLIRYNRTKDGKMQLVISHPQNLYEQIKRKYKRFYSDKIVNFKSVKFSKEEKTFIDGKNIYSGKVLNISASGICILTNLPIKNNQLLRINLRPFEIEEDVVGKIVSTRNSNKKGFYNLHIKFLTLSKSSKISIWRLVYSL